MRKINYKSDFDFLLNLTGYDGTPIGWPEWDWRLEMYVKGNRSVVYEAGCKDGISYNCFNDEDKIHIICDNHGLGTGMLYGEFYADVPNPMYFDGKELTVTPFYLDITLVSGVGDEPTDAEIEASVAMWLKYVTPWEYAVKNGYEGTEEEYLAALNDLPAVVAELRRLIDGIPSGQTGDSSIINLNAQDRDTTYTFNSAIQALTGRPPYGVILMFVNKSSQFEMWHFTGRDYTDAGDWEPVGVRLDADYIFINSDGTPSDLGVNAGASTQWAAN